MNEDVRRIDGAEPSVQPTAADDMEKLYAELVEKSLHYNPTLDRARLRRASEFAREKHGSQLRKDGSPYISHPLAAASICAGMGLDEDSIIACLLHDTIEDTDATYEEVAKLFGSEVADLVEGVTKLTRVVYTTKEEAQMENLRKIYLPLCNYWVLIDNSARQGKWIAEGGLSTSTRIYNKRLYNLILNIEKPQP